MNLTSAKTGDLILADLKGRRFYAEIIRKDGQTLEVMPLDNRITYRRVTARQVKQLWRRSRMSQHAPKGDGEAIIAPRGMQDY